MAGDPVSARHRHRLTAPRDRGARDREVRAMFVEFLNSLIHQAQSHQLDDVVIGDIPADRSASLGEGFDDVGVDHGIDLQPAEGPRRDHAVKARFPQAGNQFRRETLLAFELPGGGAQHGMHRPGLAHQRVRLNIYRKARGLDRLVHGLFPSFTVPVLTPRHSARSVTCRGRGWRPPGLSI